MNQLTQFTKPVQRTHNQMDSILQRTGEDDNQKIGI